MTKKKHWKSILRFKVIYFQNRSRKNRNQEWNNEISNDHIHIRLFQPLSVLYLYIVTNDDIDWFFLLLSNIITFYYMFNNTTNVSNQPVTLQ